MFQAIFAPLAPRAPTLRPAASLDVWGRLGEEGHTRAAPGATWQSCATTPRSPDAHDNRHTLATELAESGADDEDDHERRWARLACHALPLFTCANGSEAEQPDFSATIQ